MLLPVLIIPFKPNKVQKGTMNKIVYYIGPSSITVWQRNLESKLKRQEQTNSRETMFMRKTAKCTWRDHNTNEEILNELKVTSILDKITSHKSHWTQYVNQMPRPRLPNLLTKYPPRGIRHQGRPLKRLLEE
jgi:hypothetical protein